MALKMEVSCSRCKRTDYRSVENAAEADAFETRETKRQARLQEIVEFFAKIPTDELPDFMVVGGADAGLVHLNLCDPKGDEAKRSCKKRIDELMKSAGPLETRKPRTKKTKDAGEAPASDE